METLEEVYDKTYWLIEEVNKTLSCVVNTERFFYFVTTENRAVVVELHYNGGGDYAHSIDQFVLVDFDSIKELKQWLIVK